MSKLLTQELKDKLLSFILERYKNKIIKILLVRGSYMYDTVTDGSDIDIFIVYENEKQEIKEEIKQEINDTTHDGVHEEVEKEELNIDNKKLDIALITEHNFIQYIKVSSVRSLEAVFVPENNILFGDISNYYKYVTLHPPNIRKAFGMIADQAFNRGKKKLTLETDPKEIIIGKKSIYHSLKYLVIAVMLYKHKKIIWDDPELEKTRQFYFKLLETDIKDIYDIVDNKKILKKQYVDYFKSLDKEFRKIPNEEQLLQEKKIASKNINKK